MPLECSCSIEFIIVSKIQSGTSSVGGLLLYVKSELWIHLPPCVHFWINFLKIHPFVNFCGLSTWANFLRVMATSRWTFRQPAVCGFVWGSAAHVERLHIHWLIRIFSSWVVDFPTLDKSKNSTKQTACSRTFRQRLRNAFTWYF